MIANESSNTEFKQEIAKIKKNRKWDDYTFSLILLNYLSVQSSFVKLTFLEYLKEIIETENKNL